MADTFKQGDKVERSGIYRVVHDQYHAQDLCLRENVSAMQSLRAQRALCVGSGSDPR